MYVGIIVTGPGMAPRAAGVAGHKASRTKMQSRSGKKQHKALCAAGRDKAAEPQGK